MNGDTINSKKQVNNQQRKCKTKTSKNITSKWYSLRKLTLKNNFLKLFDIQAHDNYNAVNLKNNNKLNYPLMGS